jgi:HAD superfamily hydrolase (TIGR01450 family)
MTTDIFGKPADLCAKRLWLLDMDGTIYCEDGIFPGTLDFLREIRTRGGRYVFITNNSSKSVTDYLKKVSGMGIPATYEDFYTSSQATARFLTRHYPGAKVYCQGTRSLIRELQDSGIDVTVEVEPVDVVLLGFDLELTSEKLRRTCQILTEQKQAAYYAKRAIAREQELGITTVAGFYKLYRYWLESGKKLGYSREQMEEISQKAIADTENEIHAQSMKAFVEDVRAELKK